MRNAVPIWVFPFPIWEKRRLTQEILKGPKLKGSSSSSGKYRSHFFCTQKNQESLLSERKETPAHCSHTGARCQRGRSRKRQNWIRATPTRVTDTTRQKFGHTFSNIFFLTLTTFYTANKYKKHQINQQDTCNHAAKKIVFNNSKYAFYKGRYLKNIK